MNQKKPVKEPLAVTSDKGVRSGTGKKIAKTTTKYITRIVLTVFLIFVITGCIVAGSMAVYFATHEDQSLDFELADLKEKQVQTSIIYGTDPDGNQQELVKLHGVENRIWVDLEEIPQILQQAYVSIEDERFYKHDGVDWQRTISSFANMFVSIYGEQSGGSTLTQQLIKNVTKNDDVTIVRKVQEIMRALELEKKYTKDDIMEGYLNTLYLGHGCYGVKVAAETYFGKEVKDLDLAEAACIAAITKFPNKYDPIYHPEANKERQEYCLRKMMELGYITQTQYDSAVAEELVFAVKDEEEDESLETTRNWYLDQVIMDVKRDLCAKYNYPSDYAEKMLYEDGLQIYAALDMNIQNIMEDVYANRTNFPATNMQVDEQTGELTVLPQSAMAVMDYTGRVVGIVGGADPKEGNMLQNRATMSVRSPGSSIKPLSVYSPALEYNAATWSTTFPDQPMDIWVGGMRPGTWPRNYVDTYGPDTTVDVAVQKSLNTVPAYIVKMLSPSRCFEFLTDHYHFSTLDEERDVNYAPIATGSFDGGVKVLEMTAAYQAIGNGGSYYKPYTYYKVTNADGTKVLLENNPEPEAALSADTSVILNRLLQRVITGSNATARGYNIDHITTFAKTGTTSDAKDRWFAGGSSYYVGVTWFGFDIQKQIKVYNGSNPAGKVWLTVMNRIHENLENKPFPTSDNVVQRSYCTVSGKAPTPACKTIATGYFKSQTKLDSCDVCGKAATESTASGEGANSEDAGGTPVPTIPSRPSPTTP